MDVHVDPKVPPLPQHISIEQAKAYTSPLTEDAERLGLIKQSIKHMTEKVLGH